MNTEYKGYTIEFASNGIRIDTGRYQVTKNGGTPSGFNPDGYATENAAKGAITKHLKADVVKPVEGTDLNVVVTNGLREKSIVKIKTAMTGDKEYASLDAIKSNADRTTAMLRYRGLVGLDGTPRNRDKRSRNKREGGYAGKRAEYRVSYDDTLTKIPAKHWRAHPSKGYDTLKTYAKFIQSLDLGE